MASSLGNTGVSSLLKSAASAQQAIETLTVNQADQVWNDSAKTDADYAQYQNTLKPIATKYQSNNTTSGQEKLLTYQNKLVSATNSYQSAQVKRAQINIDQGSGSQTDKVNLLAHLYSQASDPSDQQAILAQYDSAVKTLDDQNTAATNAQTAAVNKGYTNEISKLEQGVNQLKGAALAGEITPAQYNTRMQQLYTGNKATGAPGILSVTQGAIQATGDPNGTFQSKLNSYASNPDVQKFISGTSAAQSELGQPSQVVTRDMNGNYRFVDRSGKDITGAAPAKNPDGSIATDANGHAIISYKYALPQATVANSGANKGKVSSFEYATNVDNHGHFAPGTGPGEVRQITQNQIQYDDKSGVPYFYNDQGQKKFVGVDNSNGHAIMSNTPDVVNGTVLSGGKSNTFDPLGRLGNGLVGAIKGGAGGGLLGALGGGIGGLLNNGKSTPKVTAAPAVASKPGSTAPAAKLIKPAALPSVNSLPKLPAVKPAPAKPAPNLVNQIAQSAPVKAVENVGNNIIKGAQQFGSGIVNDVTGAANGIGGFLGKIF